jgi:ornithine cyclodeaminase/alanine dehydrogenase-like protein (mu-crystallin family)
MAAGKRGSTSSVGVDRLDRRAFLRRSLAGAGASAVFAVPAVQHLAERPLVKTRTAYRLSTHGRRTCSACKAHAANRFYRTLASTSDRAHVGCNCTVVTQAIKSSLWSCYFQRGGRRNVYDLRWQRPTCPAP